MTAFTMHSSWSIVKKAEKGEVINQAVLSFCIYIFRKSVKFIFMIKSSQSSYCQIYSVDTEEKTFLGVRSPRSPQDL